ncbi:MAG: transposase [Acidobacteriota bacterium]|nr:transposase [Acidobacteriota bacterium]
MRPEREQATKNGRTYFVTSSTAGRLPLFRHERWAQLFLEMLYHYRPERYFLHGFTVMPDHFHCLLTPCGSLESAVQCLKGGFSFRARREFAWKGAIWVAGFSDHRIRDTQDFETHQRYMARNAVKGNLAVREEEYPYSSANGEFELDAFPPGLKPGSMATLDGAA